MRTESRNETLLFAYALLGFWLGVYAFRAYVATSVWNLADALPLALKGALAIGVHLIAVAGAFTPIAKHRRSAVVLAATVAAIGALRQIFISNDSIGSALSLAGWIGWVWWLAAFARTVVRIDVLVAAFAAAFAFQTGMQVAWQGLDMPHATGPLAIACAAALNIAFALLARLHRAEPTARAPKVFLAVGFAMFMELTLLANVGRVSQMTDLSLIASALLIQGGAVAGIVFSAFAPRKGIAAVVLVVYVLLAMIATGPTAAVMLFIAHAALIVALASTGGSLNAAVGVSGGIMSAFVLVFLFYNFYEAPLLWLMAALTLAGLTITSFESTILPRWSASVAGASALLTLIAAATTREAVRTPHDGLRVLTYNIHQGYDAFGVPAMQSIADEIERFDADVIALQEVGRGWNFVGGADLVAYLRYRFPGYSVHFSPTNGTLWGVALLSRLPVTSAAGGVFDAQRGEFRYGYVKARVRHGNRDVPVASVHLTAGLEGRGESGRMDQTEQLLNAMAGDAVAVVAGDFNAQPHDEPIQRMLANDYTDAGVQTGLAGIRTWPASVPGERLDYIFVKGNLQIKRGEVRRTNASDHLPVLMELR